MIDTQTAQMGVLVISLTLLIAQLWVAKKQTLHILFAIFCASVAMSTAKQISGDSVGSLQYLIGMGACATCNVYWLMARTFFREKQPFNIHHLGFAGVIAFLIMARQGHMLVDSVWGLSPQTSQFALGVIGELTVMLSSVVLILSCWEALRGFQSANSVEKAQRVTFLMMFVGAVAVTKIATIVNPNDAELRQLVIACVTVSVLLVTQALMIWRTRYLAQSLTKNEPTKIENSVELGTSSQALEQTSLQIEPNENKEDLLLANQIKSLLIENQQFLQTNLKVGDIARELNLPEYRISKVMKEHCCAKNFNQFVNELRIEHAKRLLLDEEKKKWPVLVVGLESGFASVGPFTRAFKATTGYTPNQYRKAHLS